MNFLETMMARRYERIRADYGDLSGPERDRLATGSREPRDFAAVLRDSAEVAVIAEVKKASPSAGAIAPACVAGAQAISYQQGGAAAVSVLTEPEYFGGSFGDLAEVAAAVDVPVLCKDFVVDPVQLYVARGHGADAVLLMVSVLGHLTRDLAAVAVSLGMTPVVEIASADELVIALGAPSGVIAVNARDLRTLAVDAERARELMAEARDFEVTLVAASGISTRGDVEAAASAGADAVLVGETLMRSLLPEETVRGLTGVTKGAEDGQ